MKKEVILGVFILLSLTFILALDIPQNPPQQFFGEVSYNGTLIGEQYGLTLKLTGVNDAECSIISGRYGYDKICFIEAPASNNGIVEFYLCSQKIGQTSFSSGEVTRLDLNISFYPTCIQTPAQFCGDLSCNNNENCTTCSSDCGVCPINTCGDAVCNGTESCSSCSSDCGVCPSGSSSSSGGGGGSGGRSTTSAQVIVLGNNNSGNNTSEKCDENWACYAWSNSEKECGTRECLDLSLCGTEEKKPVLEKECESEDGKGLFSSIFGTTGASVALDKYGNGIVSLIIMIIVIIVLIWIFTSNKKGKEHRIEEAIKSETKSVKKNNNTPKNETL